MRFVPHSDECTRSSLNIALMGRAARWKDRSLVGKGPMPAWRFRRDLKAGLRQGSSLTPQVFGRLAPSEAIRPVA